MGILTPHGLEYGLFFPVVPDFTNVNHLYDLLCCIALTGVACSSHDALGCLNGGCDTVDLKVIVIIEFATLNPQIINWML